MPTLGTSAASALDPWAVEDRIGLADARFALDSVLMPRPNLGYLDYRSGVMASGDTAGVPFSTHMAMFVRPTGGMAVTVEMGNAVINTPGNGAYMCALDSKKTLALDPSSSTTNRIDLIVARVYDDQNPAIASPAGVRKFVVEVWKGDPSTGSPNPPTPTIAGGWTPLAAVFVLKGVGGITADMIKDRRGPGLVARGGMRALYGEDAFSSAAAYQEVGAYPGDQRWVHGNGFPHQVYWGANADRTVGGWRGVHNEMVYVGKPPDMPNMTWYKGVNSVTEIARVFIPYPGTPFVVYPSGRFNPYISPRTSIELRICRDSATGTPVNFAHAHTFGQPDPPGDHPLAINVTPITDGPFTGPLTLVMNALIREAPNATYGFGFNQAPGTGQHVLSVLVKPATIDPTKIWG